MRNGDGDFGRGGKVGGSAQGKGGGERSGSSVKENACEERRASQTRGSSGESKSAIITRLEKEVLVSVMQLLAHGCYGNKEQLITNASLLQELRNENTQLRGELASVK